MALYGEVIKEKEKILDKLELLDILCERKGIEIEFTIIGGAGILLLLEEQNRSFRPTRDIDIKLLSHSGNEDIYDLLKSLQIEIVGGVVDLPPFEDFVDGEKHVIDAGFTSIKVYVPSIELLACTKIFSKREKDLRDLQETDILNLCNMSKLTAMVEEYREYMINPHDPDVNIHQFLNILEKR